MLLYSKSNKKITICAVHVTNKNLLHRGLKYMTSGRGCKKLQHLDISGCNQVTSEGCLVLAHNCRLLKTLHVNDNDSIGDDGLAVCFYIQRFCSFKCYIESLRSKNDCIVFKLFTDLENFAVTVLNFSKKQFDIWKTNNSLIFID